MDGLLWLAMLVLLTIVEAKRRVLLLDEQGEDDDRGVAVHHMNPSVIDTVVHDLHGLHIDADKNNMRDMPPIYHDTKEMRRRPMFDANSTIIDTTDAKYMQGPKTTTTINDTRGPPVPDDMSKLFLPQDADMQHVLRSFDPDEVPKHLGIDKQNGRRTPPGVDLNDVPMHPGADIQSAFRASKMAVLSDIHAPVGFDRKDTRRTPGVVLNDVPVHPAFDAQRDHQVPPGTGNYMNGTHRQLVGKETHRVVTLPGLDLKTFNSTQYAGHVVADEATNGHFFYWLFEAATNPESAPLVIWLNGGPGCSSMDGLFLELGPFRIDNNNNLRINPYSWHNVANVVFIDQPVGTGLSYTEDIKNGFATSDDEVNTHFYQFLVNFFKLHNNYLVSEKRTRPIYLTGESHAGHYIPSLVSYLIKQNKNSDKLYIDVKGIALGNPWTDPVHQYDVSDYAHGIGLISQGQKNRLKELNNQCVDQLKNKKYNQQTCLSLLDSVIGASSVGGSSKVLMYDSRKYAHNSRQFPAGHDVVERYLNRRDVLVAIHADKTPNKYVECADPPYYALVHQDGKSATAELVDVLNADIRVLVYVGQYDIICNHLGVEKMLSELQWKYSKKWNEAQPGVWVVDSSPVGHVKAFNNLQYALILDSGHMMPMDSPSVAMTMIEKFIHDKSLVTGLTKIMQSSYSEC